MPSVLAHSTRHWPTRQGSPARPGPEQVWIIGRGTVYRDAMAWADTAVITRIDTDTPRDTCTPVLGPEWKLVSSSPAEGWSTAASGTRYRIETWQAC